MTEEFWGPPQEVEENHRFASVPFGIFSKSDRIGRVVDWTGPQRSKENVRFNRRPDRQQAQQQEAPAAVLTLEATEEEGFHLVDTRVAPKPKWGQQKGGQRQAQPQAAGQKRDGPGGSHYRAQLHGARGAPGAAKSQQQQQRGGDAGRSWDRNKVPKVRDFSVTVTPEWELKKEIAFSALQKLVLHAHPAEDVAFVGSVKPFNKAFDRISTKNNKALTRSDIPAIPPSTLDDPVIERLASEGKGNVFATDAVIAALMAAPRSIYSWDIVVNKEGSNLYLSARDGGNLETVSVNETAQEPPEDDGKDSVNNAGNLDAEATQIQTNFRAMVGANDEAVFSAGGDAPVGDRLFRYRRFKLAHAKHGAAIAKAEGEQEEDENEEDDAPNQLIVRCEIDSVIPNAKEGQNALLTVRALNEFDPKAKDSVDWRQKIDTQAGGVLAACLKNNSNRLARIACNALVAGTELIKIGYVSRVRVTDNKQHVILGCKTYKPPEFARQMDINEENMWGIVKGVVDYCMTLDDGQYVLVKDPARPIILLYSVPLDAFAAPEEQGAEGDDQEGDD